MPQLRLRRISASCDVTFQSRGNVGKKADLVSLNENAFHFVVSRCALRLGTWENTRVLRRERQWKIHEELLRK